MKSKLLAALLLCFSLNTFAAEEVTPEKIEVVKELLRASGATGISKQISAAMSEQMRANMKATHPEIKDSMIDRISTGLAELFEKHVDGPGGLIEYAAPSYAQNYTLDELKQILAFYKSPIGQRVVAQTPIVLGGTIKAGQEWAKSLRSEVQIVVLSAMVKEGAFDKQPNKASPATPAAAAAPLATSAVETK